MSKFAKNTSNSIILDIHALSHDGRGIAILNGKTVFIHGALPGETVSCQITHQHKRYNEGKVVQVISPAKGRELPLCKHFGICGGCSLQHMETHAQIQFKQQAVLEQLKHFGNVTPEVLLPPMSGDIWGYRKKARLGVRYVIKKNKLLVGFREKFTNYITEIEHCPILHPSIQISELTQLVQDLNQFNQIPQIEVAVGDDTQALIFRHLKDLPQNDIEQLCHFGKNHSFHIYLHPNPPQTIHKIWPNDQAEFLNYALPDYQLNIRFHPLFFTQINSMMNVLMIKKAIELLDIQPDDTILDLFCGIGNFTLPIARYAKQVIGIEGSDLMVKAAEENAILNNITNTAFYQANLMQPSQHSPWLQQSYHKILLDPPRTGAKEILPYFHKLNPKKIVYVSCNPATLARDAGYLVHQQGYILKTLGIINMFPHTSHIESIALFEK